MPAGVLFCAQKWFQRVDSAFIQDSRIIVNAVPTDRSHLSVAKRNLIKSTRVLGNTWENFAGTIMKEERRYSLANRAHQRRTREALRFSRVPLLMAAIKVIISLQLIHHAHSSKNGVEVTRFIDNERLATCNSELARFADENGELDSQELVGLVGALSKGRISVEQFRDLPLRLRMIYHWIACSCVFELGASSDCCIGDAAHVNIDEAETTLPFMLNRMFCSELERGIDKVTEDFPPITDAPTDKPSAAPTAPPTTSLTSTPSSAPSESPSAEVSESPIMQPPPTISPTASPTISPTPPPTDAPPETLCITFQYELVNNRSLTADDVMNENNNTLKTGLEEATRTIVIQLLNETYPRTARAPPSSKVEASYKRHNPNDWRWNNQAATSHDPNDWIWSDIIGGRRRLPMLREAVVRADAAVLGMDMQTYSSWIHRHGREMYNNTRRSLQLHVCHGCDHYIRGSRRLVYYTDEIPVEIPIIIDNPNCPSNNANDGENTIRCAIVSSRLCVVLEAGDNPDMIRTTLVRGLSDSIESGDFEDQIPQERFEGV